jgi:hypothetical protein
MFLIMKEWTLLWKLWNASPPPPHSLLLSSVGWWVPALSVLYSALGLIPNPGQLETL